MNSIEQLKDVYVRPETEPISIAPMESIVQNISNPGGGVTPIDPNEE